VVRETAYEIRDRLGSLVAVHVREDLSDGDKDLKWARPGKGGTRISGLGGLPVMDLPPYGAHARHPDRPTIHVEGEKARDALAPLAEPLGYNVVGHVTGAPATHSPDALSSILSPRHFLWADSDEPGQRQMDRTHETLRALMREEWDIPMMKSKELIRRITWEGARPGDGDDAADFVAQGGTIEKLRQLLDEAVPWNAAAEQRPDDSRALPSAPGSVRSRVVTAAMLQRKTFPPVPFAVPGILPQGAALLVGPPKIGKSRLILQLGCAVAYGGVALSHTEVAQGGVLVLALEDGQRRLHERLSALLSGETTPWPESLAFATEWSTLNEGGAEELDEYLTAHQDTRLVIVDVLQMIRPPTSSKQNAYAADYAAMRILKGIADRHDVTVLILHHTRKMDASDPLDLVSGTNGLAGAVDSVLILQREPNGSDATLYLRGRDVEEAQFKLAYDRVRGAWNIVGDTRPHPLSVTREKIISALEEAWPKTMSPKEVVAATGLSENVVSQRLHHLEQAGQIRRIQRGQYTLVDAPPRKDEDAPDSTSYISSRKERKERKVEGEATSDPSAEPRGDGVISTVGSGLIDADSSSQLTNLTTLTTRGEVGDPWAGARRERL
jgi:hypothetical protein